MERERVKQRHREKIFVFISLTRLELIAEKIKWRAERKGESERESRTLALSEGQTQTLW